MISINFRFKFVGRGQQCNAMLFQPSSPSRGSGRSERRGTSCVRCAKEAADQQRREIQQFLVLARDHVIDSSDLFVLVVDDSGADQLAHPIAVRHDRKINFDKCDPACESAGSAARVTASAVQIIPLDGRCPTTRLGHRDCNCINAGLGGAFGNL
jgi:hypothetical protein